jgi:protein SCO1/2
MPVTRRAALAAIALTAMVGFSSPALAEVRVLGADQTGRKLDETKLAGWRLVYFGYTHCPDDCPLGLQTMAEAVDGLGPLADRVTPVFVTVDPDRDTTQVMANYVDFFHPRLIGVTPSAEELAVMGKAWRVKYAKVEVGEGRPYLMDHTASIFLVDPAGSIVGRFSHTLSAEQMTAKIRTVLETRS